MTQDITYILDTRPPQQSKNNTDNSSLIIDVSLYNYCIINSLIINKLIITILSNY